MVATFTMTEMEERVVRRVRQSRDHLVDVASDLVAYDTTSREPGDEPRDETRLQQSLAEHLRQIGAHVDLWEPQATGKGNRFVPDDLDFRGRPQLLARIEGSGGGRTLLLNGHIDAVTPGGVERWTTDPFKAETRDGRLYGRGSADMKGGIASMLVALQCLHAEGISLAGDVVFCTNTDEESSGAGGYAVVAHGVSADGGICAEPTGFEVWTACRGTWMANVTLHGRAGHAEMPPAHWSQGGAVNAIEKLGIVLQALQSMRDDWRQRPDHQHALLAPGDAVPTVVRGGEWLVTYPESCSLSLDVTYLPGHVDADGSGAAVGHEVMSRIRSACSCDPWLAEHPPEFHLICDTVPAEIPADSLIVQTLLGTATAVGRTPHIAGLDSWHDAATYSRFGIPTVSFGPGGMETAHAVDESVPVDDLVDHAASVAVAAMRFCGTER